MFLAPWKPQTMVFTMLFAADSNNHDIYQPKVQNPATFNVWIISDIFLTPQKRSEIFLKNGKIWTFSEKMWNFRKSVIFPDFGWKAKRKGKQHTKNRKNETLATLCCFSCFSTKNLEKSRSCRKFGYCLCNTSGRFSKIQTFFNFCFIIFSEIWGGETHWYFTQFSACYKRNVFHAKGTNIVNATIFKQQKKQPKSAKKCPNAASTFSLFFPTTNPEKRLNSSSLKGF